MRAVALFGLLCLHGARAHAQPLRIGPDDRVPENPRSRYAGT